jgi:hypothetical protein
MGPFHKDNRTPNTARCGFARCGLRDAIRRGDAEKNAEKTTGRESNAKRARRKRRKHRARGEGMAPPLPDSDWCGEKSRVTGLGIYLVEIATIT